MPAKFRTLQTVDPFGQVHLPGMLHQEPAIGGEHAGLPNG
jgi:hypothetical protein